MCGCVLKKGKTSIYENPVQFYIMDNRERLTKRRYAIKYLQESKSLRNPKWFDNVVTTNESCDYMYDPLTKQQSSK